MEDPSFALRNSVFTTATKIKHADNNNGSKNILHDLIEIINIRRMQIRLISAYGLAADWIRVSEGKGYLQLALYIGAFYLIQLLN